MGSQEERVIMNIFSLLCLFIGIVCCESGRPHPACWEQCGLASLKASITCTTKDYIRTTECICKDKEGEIFTCTEKFQDGADVDLFEKSQTWEECQQLAQHEISNGDLGNNFFRWEIQKSPELETKCYLLENCDDKLPTHCSPFEGSSCVAGHSEGCDPEAKYDCTAATWNEEDLHWTCLSPDGTDTSVYGDASTRIKGDTTCHTLVCPHWEWNDGEDHSGKIKAARVKCGESGWEKLDDEVPFLKNVDDDQLIKPDFNDAPCHCTTLTPTEENMNNPGLSLLCNDPLTPEGGIEYGNACTLLCDGHFMMYIECYLGGWKNTASYPPDPVDDSKIKC